MKKNFLFLSIALFTAISLSAQTSVWSGGSDVWTKGAGTEASPFLIESADQLSFVAEMVNAGITDYQGTYFRLTKDMDFNHLVWVPIGESEVHPFKGNIDGANHILSNLRVPSGIYSGLFGYVENATIENITLKGDSIVGTYAGGLAGYASSCSINHCANFLKVISNHNAGGICGKTNTSIISQSSNYGEVFCELLEASNITHRKRNGTSQSPSSRTYFHDDTISTQYNGIMCAGGIVGCSFNDSLCSCNNFNKIASVFDSRDYDPLTYNYDVDLYKATGHHWYFYVLDITPFAGGVVANNNGSKIQDCINHSAIDSKIEVGDYHLSDNFPNSDIRISSMDINEPVAGGIAGKSTDSSIIKNCANHNSVNASYYDGKKYVILGNGISGTSTAGMIAYCYNVGECTIGIGGTTVKNSYNAGTTSSYGISSGTVNNCYYSQGTGNGTQKSEAQMKSITLPILLNTDSTVFTQDTYNVNNGYPIFVDQVYAISDRPNSIDFTKAELAGHLYAPNADSIGFEYKALDDNIHWYNSVTVEGENSVSYEIENLSVGTEYTYRLWVEREGVRYYGDTINFKTLECSQEITPLSATICAGEEYAFGEKQLTEEGIYRDTLTAVNGCDSIVELTLVVNPTIDIEKKDTISAGESYDFYGEILTETGDYYHYIPMGNKCNRVVLHLFVESSATSVENIEEISAPKKLIRDGQIFILRGDKIYTLQGQEVR